MYSVALVKTSTEELFVQTRIARSSCHGLVHIYYSIECLVSMLLDVEVDGKFHLASFPVPASPDQAPSPHLCPP